ncbi:hypothetical protein [Spiroplasma endosymbiont of Tipula paludosa]
MYKFISWLVIAFIGLVPLGAFFDRKQPQKPNMEQFFMKREKRATNPSQCEDSCELEFSSIKNSGLIIIPNVKSVMIDFTKSDILLPNFLLPQKQFYLASSEFTNLYNKNGVYKKINGYRIYNFTYDVDSYWLEEIVNVKISFEKVSSLYRIVLFSAEMPPLPEKDNEQPLPTKITKNDGEYQYTQFQDKLDYLMIQRRDFDKFNYSYLY